MMTYSAPGESVAAQVAGFITTGTYVGNGTSQSFTLPFQPRVVHVVADTSSASRNGGFKNSSMASNNAIATNGGAATGITITSTGFSVDAGTQFNYLSANYYYVAFK